MVTRIEMAWLQRPIMLMALIRHVALMIRRQGIG